MRSLIHRMFAVHNSAWPLLLHMHACNLIILLKSLCSVSQRSKGQEKVSGLCLSSHSKFMKDNSMLFFGKKLIGNLSGRFPF